MQLGPRHVHTSLRTSHGALGAAEHGSMEKTYPRFPKITLSKASLPATLDHALAARQSKRTSSGMKLTFPMLGTILEHALGIRGELRNYPSGGAKFPIETYLLAMRVDGLERHAYHFAPSLHALEDLWEIPAEPGVFEGRLNAPWEKDVLAFVFFGAAWDRSSEKYGDFALELALLEAGHMAQNVLLCAGSLGLHACPFGGFNDGIVTKLLDLTDEQPVYGIALL